MQIGLGDILLLAMALILFILWALGERADRRARARNAQMIRAAQSVEIAEGVTLLQGMRAYFGEDGYWTGVDGSVGVLMDGPGRTWAALCVHLETGEIQVYSSALEDREDAGALLDALVRAARTGERASGA